MTRRLKTAMAVERRRAGMGVAVTKREELTNLRTALQKAPHGAKWRLVQAFAKKHAITTTSVYRAIASLPGSVSRRKTRVDAGLRKIPRRIVQRRAAFKAMERIRKFKRSICATLNEAEWLEIQLLEPVDWKGFQALQEELSQHIADIEAAVSRLRWKSETSFRWW
jgi:hypothetical protein